MRHYHKNPRQITDRQFKDLKTWLTELGDLSGIVHDLNSDESIGGNMRLEAMGLMGATPVITETFDTPTEQGTVAVGYFEHSGERYAYRAVRWTAEQCEKANIVANKAGGSWDFDVLANQWELDELLEWGFEESELQLDWGNDAAPDPGAQVDKAAELQEKWKVSRGQIWQCGRHKIMCGDSTCAEDVARLMGGERADLCHADPPYGIDASNMTMGAGQSTKPKEARLSHKQNWDSVRLDVSSFLDTSERTCVWGGNYFADVLPTTNDWLCWHKKNDGRSFSEFELAWTDYGIQTRHFAHHWGGEVKEHITQKPLAVVRWAIEICPIAVKCVYVPFLGSGTTMVAAEQTGRICNGLEIEPRYVSVVLERLTGMGLEAVLVS